MAKVEFNYKGIKTVIQCLEDEKMEEIFKKFCSKVNININNIYFLYSGNKINSELTFAQIINETDKERKIISILVDELNLEHLNNSSITIKSNFPICPDCKEIVTFDIYEHKIKLQCKNGHINYFCLNEYEEYRKLNIDKICYEQSNKSISSSLSCENELCLLCSYKQDKINNKINNFSKNYICEIHNELFISYCEDCKINICMKCMKEHKNHNHNIIYYWDILPDKNDLLQKLEEFKNEIDIYKEDIEDLIDKLNNVKEKFEILYNIYYNMINNYDDKFRNYEIFTNLNSINNNKIIEDLKKINEIKLINNKINDIIKLYEKTNYYEMDIEYEFKKGKKIKIFGNEFVDNNFDNCSIIFENEEYDLSTYFEKKYT